MFRRSRRNRKIRYRKPRFLNRRKTEGWIPPSLESRVNNIKTWVNRLQKLIPLTHISYENVKFDTQLMQNPEISGIEYQQGTLQGYEIREYLLEKFGRKCCYCGKENIPLEIEHIIPKSRGGTNRVDNLCLSCRECNQKKGNMTAEEFGYPNVQRQVKQSLKDSSVVNSTRWKVYDVLCNSGLEVEDKNISLVFKQEIWLKLKYQKENIKAFGTEKLHVENQVVLILKTRKVKELYKV